MCCLGVLCIVAGYEWHDIPGGDLTHKMCDAGTDYIENDLALDTTLELPREIHEACYYMNDGTFKNGDEQKFGIEELRSYSFLEIANWLEPRL